jgi:hypothetical protein
VAEIGELEAGVRPQVGGVGDGADDLAEQDAIDVVVGVEAEVVDGGVARRIGLGAVEIAGARAGAPGAGNAPKPGASSPLATPASRPSRWRPTASSLSSARPN